MLLLRAVCASHQWLKPVILVTEEAEIRRITIPSQHISQKKPFTKKGWGSGSRCRP
jgi:hypothetical protein